VSDELEASRLRFEASVDRLRRPARRPSGPRGKPSALLAIGAAGTAVLAACAAPLGGGLLFAPAALPLATVAAVLAARWRRGTGRTGGEPALSSSGGP
jgi:hypothetical protein